jgi:WhiB family transcriptional regulator, redox-sensing transcriptional regulator
MSIVPAQSAPEPAGPACVGTDQDLWFQWDGEAEAAWHLRMREALAICAGCPVRQACLDEALSFPASQQYGVFGGMTERQRRELLTERRRAAA